MNEQLSVLIGLRVTEEDSTRLDAVAAQLPLAKRINVARAAFRLGLQVLEQNPVLAVEAQAQPKGRR